MCRRKLILCCFVVLVVVFLSCKNDPDKHNIQEIKNHEILVPEGVWQEEIIFEENFDLEITKEQDFIDEFLKEEFSKEEIEYPNLPKGFRPYTGKIDIELGFPKDWFFEESDDGTFVKFFVKEKIDSGELKAFNAPAALFYVLKREKPKVEKLDKEWFFTNFINGDLLLYLENSELPVKVIKEETVNIGDFVFYYAYFLAYDSQPKISYYLLTAESLYEISFRTLKEQEENEEILEFKEFSQKVASTFKPKKDDFGVVTSFLSQISKEIMPVCQIYPLAQIDPKWSGKQLGKCSGITIGSHGCALTSKTIIFNYYSPGYTDPEKLNNCLTEKGGYGGGCEMKWASPVCAPQAVKYTGYLYSKKALDDQLTAGHPVISEITPCQGYMHFVVVTKKLEPGYEIIDSYDGITKEIPSNCFTIQAVSKYGSLYEGPCYACKWKTQNPNAGPYVMYPGDEKEFSVEFFNTGNAVWVRDDANGLANPDHIELWSADKDGNIVDSFLYHQSWINPQRVASLFGSNKVLPGETGQFVFKVKVPDDPQKAKVGQEVKVYFIPYHASYKNDPKNCWDGVHFWLKIEANPDCLSGQKEEASCGKCGKKTHECIAGKWSSWSGCLSEKECFSGEKQIESCGQCNYKEKVCQSDCFWGSWSSCSQAGLCAPNDEESKSCGSDVGECQKGKAWRTCKENCLWGAWGSCQGEIGPADDVCDLKDNDCNGKTDDLCFKPVYRFYYSKSGDKDHFLKNDASVPSGYVIENNGKAVFYTYKEQVSGTNPLFRLYKDSIKDHMYTDSQAEKNSVIANGYVSEGNIGYCASSQKAGTVPLYRCWSSKYSDHHSTTNKAECDTEGYSYEQLTCYVWP
jgi:hypothetical protein